VYNKSPSGAETKKLPDIGSFFPDRSILQMFFLLFLFCNFCCRSLAVVISGQQQWLYSIEEPVLPFCDWLHSYE
jgi:hypothetical protein